MVIRLSTRITPGASHATRSASSRSAHDRTLPRRAAALVVSFDFALQRHVPVPDDWVDNFRGISHLGLQFGKDLAHDLGIGPLVDPRQPPYDHI